MFALMSEVSDMYNERLLEYADKQGMFDCKLYATLRNPRRLHLSIFRINGQYTLDNIASCLFGIETNSLQSENVTLITHLKKFFTFSFTNLFLLVVCK